MAKFVDKRFFPFIKNIQFKNEQDVREKFLIRLLEELGFEPNDIKLAEPVEFYEGREKKTTKEADYVVYKNDTAILVVDAKEPKEKLNKWIGQVKSYATAPKINAQFFMLSNAYSTEVYIAHPHKLIFSSNLKELESKITKLRKIFFTASEQPPPLPNQVPFIDRYDLKHKLSQCHDEIYSNHHLNPIEAFLEMEKVLFSKIYEEMNGSREDSRFSLNKIYEYIKLHQGRRDAGDLINEIFKDTKNKFKGVFDKNEKIALGHDTIVTIVRLLENYSFQNTSLDIKGGAFEALHLKSILHLKSESCT